MFTAICRRPMTNLDVSLTLIIRIKIVYLCLNPLFNKVCFCSFRQVIGYLSSKFGRSVNRNINFTFDTTFCVLDLDIKAKITCFVFTNLLSIIFFPLYNCQAYISLQWSKVIHWPIKVKLYDFVSLTF